MIRKSRRWDLVDKEMFSSASLVDLTLLLTGKADPQDIHLQCASDLKGDLRTLSPFIILEIFRNRDSTDEYSTFVS